MKYQELLAAVDLSSLQKVERTTMSVVEAGSVLPITDEDTKGSSSGNFNHELLLPSGQQVEVWEQQKGIVTGEVLEDKSGTRVFKTKVDLFVSNGALYTSKGGGYQRNK